MKVCQFFGGYFERFSKGGSMTFEDLKDFIVSKMKLSHIY
jgi:hypothetical protein